MKDQENKLKDKMDCIDILENTVENKVMEIQRLKVVRKAQQTCEYECTFCDYICDTEDDLKNHGKA